MGNRSAKTPSAGDSTGIFRRKAKTAPRPFPVISAQSYVPGSAAATGGSGGGLYPPPSGANQYPPINSNSYPPPPYGPPAATFNTGTGPPPRSYNPMPPSRPGPRQIPYPNGNSVSIMQRPAPFYNSRRGYRPSARSSRRYSSRHCRPVVHIIRDDSCSSISTCSSSSASSCSSHRHRSRSYIKDCRAPQQQPIILLPIQCQPQSSATTTQSFALPPTSNIGSTPLIIQPLNSGRQTVSSGKPQQFQAGPIQYVQATPKSAATSQLQFMPIQTHSSVAPQHVRVNSINKTQPTVVKSILRSSTTHKII